MGDIGCNVTVLTTTANGEEELNVDVNKKISVSEKVDAYYFPRLTKDHSHFSPGLLLQVIRLGRKVDFVHIHSWWNLVAMPCLFILLLMGVKPIISIRGMLSKYTFKSSKGKRVFHELVGKYLLRNCILHVTSEKEKEECYSALNKFEGFILPNFINLPPKIEKEIKKGKIFTFATLCRIHPVKNLETTLVCLAEIKEDWRFQIIGTGEEAYIKSLKDLSEELGISEKIIWHGHIEGNAKYEILAKSDLYIQLSLTENFGNSIIEAASVSLPVFISESTGAAEYIQKLNAGWIVPLDTSVIKNRLKEVMIIISKGGFQPVPNKVREEFSGESLAGRYMTAYVNNIRKK